MTPTETDSQLPAMAPPDDVGFGKIAPASYPRAADIPPAITAVHPIASCSNCDTPLLGPTCYACGQPVKGLVRHLSSILSDAADTILNIDSRIFRTLWPLFARPGFLTCEYFAGHRVRYVTPFRLYFFLSIAAFFLMQFAIADFNGVNALVGDDSADQIAAARTVAEVTKQRDIALATLQQAAETARKNVGGGGALEAQADKKLALDIEKLQKRADQRIDFLSRVDAAKANGDTPPPDPKNALQTGLAAFSDRPWDEKANPVRVGWLPQSGNEKLNQLVGHAKDNLSRIAKDPRPFVLGAISVLPQVLFVLMPLFALLLKIFYIFKRRLYMEHLIVALHSHSFIFLSLIALILSGLVRGWAATDAPWLGGSLSWISLALGWWIPIYLFLMQKKVYGQGWVMTAVKFASIGLGYSIMISMGVAVALVVSLATT